MARLVQMQETRDPCPEGLEMKSCLDSVTAGLFPSSYTSYDFVYHPGTVWLWPITNMYKMWRVLQHQNLSATWLDRCGIKSSVKQNEMSEFAAPKTTKESGQRHEKVRITAKCLEEAKQTQAGCELLQFHRPWFFSRSDSEGHRRRRHGVGIPCRWPLWSGSILLDQEAQLGTNLLYLDLSALCLCTCEYIQYWYLLCSVLGICAVYLWPFCMYPKIWSKLFFCIGEKASCDMQ